MKRITIIATLLLLFYSQNYCVTQDYADNFSTTTNTDFFANRDPRFFVLTALGVAAGALGLWIIKKSVDKILSDHVECEEIPLRERILALGSETLATLIGLACTVGGGMLIITDKYKINSTFNT
jgi:hypothetical protein